MVAVMDEEVAKLGKSEMASFTYSPKSNEHIPSSVYRRQSV